jgi:hypothetical protein
MKMLFKIIPLLTLLLALQGCGDLFPNKIIKKSIDTSRFSATCGDPNIDDFRNIMTDNISSTIRCLGENLKLFIRLVKSDKPRYLQRTAFEAYLHNNRPDINPDVVKAIKAIFDLNYLLKGEYREYISQQNVDELIEFMILFNAQASLYYPTTFGSKNDIPSYEAYTKTQRAWIEGASKRIINQGLLQVFNPNPGNGNRDLDLVGLIDSFTTNATASTKDKINKVLFVKSVLFGGKRGVLTHAELRDRVITNFPDLAPIILDVVKYRYIQNIDRERIYNLLATALASFTKVVMDPTMGDRDKEVLFTVAEIKEVVRTFVDKNSFDVDKWTKLILEAKHVFMGGKYDKDSAPVLGVEFKNLLGHANNILQTGTSFYDMWEHFKAALESPLPVTIKFSDDAHSFPGQLAELGEFERIAKNYRFIRGKFNSAYYTKGIRRNDDGLVEIYMYEYLLRQVIKTYGTPSTSSLGGYGISHDQLGVLVKTIENELIELKLITPQRADSITDNISLLGTLFQYQSDKNGLLDANEATEFALALISSMEMSDSLMEYYKLKGCRFEKAGSVERVEPNCFKQNFFQSLCEGYTNSRGEEREGYKSYYPLLFESIGAKACSEVQASPENLSFLDVSIRAGRSCNHYVNTDGTKGDEIYFSKGDIFSTLLVLMHAEATVLRWDDVHNSGNGNNLMDADEVNRAYEIYSPALDGFLLDKPAIIKSLKKQIYQYLIKYETVPDEKEFKSIWKFVKFLVSFNKKAPAYRRTLAAILATIGEQNLKASIKLGKPQFDCNWMHNPDTIPRDKPTSLTNLRMSIQPDTSENFSGVLNYLKVDGTQADGEPVFRIEKELCLSLFKKEICL